MESKLINGAEARELAAQVIREGGLIAFRTDTFYGLGADPFNQEAVKRIKNLKGREDNKPILILISDANEADRFIAEQSELFDTVRARHWPGALTIVARARVEVPLELTAGTGTIGVRLPDDEEVRALVRACGGALTATSANPAGQSPARTAFEVSEYFKTGLDLIVDGGAARTDKPSTVLDVSGESPRVIREGVVTREQLAETFKLKK
jgi:L-threonylcarbamoyladenylate synthase